MFKVVIADDEYMVREGMTQHVPWEEFDFEVVGTAENGIDALNMVRRERPDLLLTDVRMPFLNGFDLIERALKICPNMAIVVFSGHDEFEYVQRAINSGASGYLLKPLDLNALKNLLENIKEDLKDKEQLDSMITDLTASSRKLLDAKKEQILRNMIFDLPLDEDVKLEEIGIYRDDCCIVGILKADDTGLDEKQKKLVYKSMKTCAEQGGESLTVLSTDSPSSLIFILFGKAEMIALMAEKYCADVKKELENAQIRASVYCSEIHYSVYSLNLAYNRVKAYMNYADAMQSNALTSYEFVEIKTSVLLDRAEIDAFIERLREWSEKNNIGVKVFDTLLVPNFYLQIQKRLRDTDLDITDLIGSAAEFHTELCSEQGLESRFEALRKLLIKIKDFIDKNKNKKTLFLIERVREYIAEHYPDSELSLQSVAAYCALSPNYLSNLFKQYLDINFSEYLCKIRIDKAKELLLLTDKSVYEIAELVGYENSAYFCTVFKKTVGQTPSFFRSKNNR